jgi:hypothetical protein
MRSVATFRGSNLGLNLKEATGHPCSPQFDCSVEFIAKSDSSHIDIAFSPGEKEGAAQPARKLKAAPIHPAADFLSQRRAV